MASVFPSLKLPQSLQYVAFLAPRGLLLLQGGTDVTRG